MTSEKGSGTSAQKTIVVMDDSAVVLETLRMVFEASGYAVATASNLTELETVRAGTKADLFILDVQMPEAFGDDVARVLREVRRVNVPILLFSSLEEVALRERAAEAEVDGYVSKNTGVAPLLARVTALLGQRRRGYGGNVGHRSSKRADRRPRPEERGGRGVDD